MIKYRTFPVKLTSLEKRCNNIQYNREHEKERAAILRCWCSHVVSLNKLYIWTGFRFWNANKNKQVESIVMSCIACSRDNGTFLTSWIKYWSVFDFRCFGLNFAWGRMWSKPSGVTEGTSYTIRMEGRQLFAFVGQDVSRTLFIQIGRKIFNQKNVKCPGYNLKCRYMVNMTFSWGEYRMIFGQALFTQW